MGFMKKVKKLTKRYIYNLPIQEWTMKEIEGRLKSMKKFIEDYQPTNESYKNHLSKLLVERTSRIGKNVKT